MLRYAVQLFGVTVFALGMIWFAGDGEALQLAQAQEAKEPVLWADTVHINLDEIKPKDDQQTEEQKRDTFLRDVKKLTQTAFNLRNHYMEDIDTDEIVKAGIRGMLSNLDRFSVLMEQSSYEALMESTHGKYEGLGMQIDARDNHIMIVTPIEGTPAYRRGLRAGDVIMEIDGNPTDGMKSSDAAKLMRGKAGTSVDLMIQRSGLADPIEFTVERAIIELKSVNYYGIVPGTNIGYVRLSRFAEETSHELREAIGALNDQDVSGLIFDLRSNGGGLLDQAKETAELFLQEGRDIVYTRGKYESSERRYRSERPPIFPKKPLVILVDEGTASASEIVSGAIQDWDRGLIVGNTTYGKGLVQQVFNISHDGSMALKLTTAKYYVPSGRCIQKPEKQGKQSPPHALASDDEDTKEEAADSMKVSEEEIFYTNGGRIVYGGGGIVPDVEIDREKWQPIEINLERQSMFFDYAVKYVAEHPDVTPDIEITDDIVNDFRAFIKEKEFDYKTALQSQVDKLNDAIASEEKTDEFAAPIAELELLIEKEKLHDFDKSEDYIRRTIKREIVASIAGERGVYDQIVLRTDKAVKKAVEILSSPDEYSRLILEGQKEAAVN